MFTPEDEKEIVSRLNQMTHDVKVILFSQSLNCETCPDTERLIRALAALSERIKLDVLNPMIDKDAATKYKVELVPTIILEGDRDYGIRYWGIPAGYEFACLLEDIVSIGKRESGLTEASKELIRELTEPLDLKVFVTPT
jgi:glutaredoxin-like protein